MKTYKRKCKLKGCTNKIKSDKPVDINRPDFCSEQCKLKFIEAANIKKREQQKLAAEKQQRKLDRKINAMAKKGLSNVMKQKAKAHRERKEALKPRSKLLDRLQELVNQYVLIRDENEPCYTCGDNSDWHQYHAGHYRTRGASPETRFNLMNIHKQCVRCNKYLSGNIKPYRENLINDYGIEEVEKLEGPHDSLKIQFPDLESIKKMIVKYRIDIRDLGHKPRV